MISYLIALFKQRLHIVRVADYRTTLTARKSAAYYSDAKMIHKNVLRGTKTQWCIIFDYRVTYIDFFYHIIILPRHWPRDQAAVLNTSTAPTYHG